MKASAKERLVLQGLYHCLSRMTGCRARNPADIKTQIQCLNRMNKASRYLLSALQSFAFDPDDSLLEINKAKELLEAPFEK